MTGKVLLVTGGSRGIGAAICRKAASAGWRVMINYVANEPAASALAEDIRKTGGTAAIVQGDAGTEAGIQSIFSAVDATFGRLDGFVNNAGVVDFPQRVEDFSWARLERMFTINVVGAVHAAGQAVKRMSNEHGGQGGAIVIGLEPDSPAAEGGFLVGDIVTTWEGNTVRSVADVALRLGAGTVGTTARLGVLRGGNALELDVTIGERPRR